MGEDEKIDIICRHHQRSLLSSVRDLQERAKIKGLFRAT